MKKGRRPRIKDIKEAQELLSKGVSVRKTAWAILKRNDPGTIARWAKVDVRKLEKELSTP